MEWNAHYRNWKTAVAGLAGLLMFLTLALEVRPVSAARPMTALSGLPVMPQVRLESLPPLSSPRPRASGLTVGELMGLLGEKVDPPVARRVASEFMKEPALIKAWNGIGEVDGPETPAGELVGRLARLPEFRKLISKLSADAEVRSALASVAQDPRLKPLARDIRSARAALAVGRTERSRAAEARQSARGPASPAPGSPSARASAGYQASRASDDMASLFSTAPGWVRERLEAYCAEYGCENPLQACSAVGVYEECVTACASNARCSSGLALGVPAVAAPALSAAPSGVDSSGSPSMKESSDPGAPAPGRIGGEPSVAPRIAEESTLARPPAPGLLETAGRDLGGRIGSVFGRAFDWLGDPAADDAVKKRFADQGAEFGKRVSEAIEGLVLAVAQVVTTVIARITETILGLLDRLLKTVG